MYLENVNGRLIMWPHTPFADAKLKANIEIILYKNEVPFMIFLFNFAVMALSSLRPGHTGSDEERQR